MKIVFGRHEDGRDATVLVCDRQKEEPVSKIWSRHEHLATEPAFVYSRIRIFKMECVSLVRRA